MVLGTDPRIRNTGSKYNKIQYNTGRRIWKSLKLPEEWEAKYLADEDLTDVRRLVEGLAVDGLLALDDGGEVHQPAREMPPVELDSSLPERTIVQQSASKVVGPPAGS